tara:strand:+ start:355 stop:996 length:642 start_codon:yes stop_codon:yes gene_type:complete
MRIMLSWMAMTMSVNTVFAWDSWEFMTQSKVIPPINPYINIRKFVIDLQGKNKRILDIGCGVGDSTSNGKGCLGIDNDRDLINDAKKKYPEKKFRLGVITYWESEKKYHITTSMFYLHKLDASKRKNIINVAKNCATERVVILDVSPNYKPCDELIKEKPHLLDFIKNSREELSDFTEHTMVEDNISLWTYDIKKNNNDNDSLERILRLYRHI